MKFYTESITTYLKLSPQFTVCSTVIYQNVHLVDPKHQMVMDVCIYLNRLFLCISGERGGSVVECRTPEREVRGSKPTAAVLCP